VTRLGLGVSTATIGIVVPKVGVLTIQQSGRLCPGYRYAALLQLGEQRWGFGYQGDAGYINVTVNADSTVGIGGTGTPGGKGEVFPGGC
jgi:hypothetical protein